MRTIVSTLRTKIENNAKVQKVKELYTRVKLEIWMALATGTALQPTYAATDPNAMIKGIIEQIMALFPAIGVVIALVGAFKLYMAFRNDQPDSYSNAIKDIVIGALLIVFKATIWDNVLKPAL